MPRGSSPIPLARRRRRPVAMRALVTGASGMLGRATAQLLLHRGDDVHSFQRDRPASPAEVLGDIADPVPLRGREATMPSSTSPRRSSCRPLDRYARVNIQGTRNVRCLPVQRVGRLVHVSSPSVAHSRRSRSGGRRRTRRPAQGTRDYSRSKAVAEQEALAADPGLAVLVVRPHLVWGPGDTQLVARIVGGRELAGFPLGSGAALIDTTYVDNAATALAAAVSACGTCTASSSSCRTANRARRGDPGRLCASGGGPWSSRHVPFRAAWLAGAAIEGVWA